MHRFMNRPHGDILQANICAPLTPGGHFTLVDVLTRSKADFNFENIKKDLLLAKDMPALCFNKAFKDVVGKLANHVKQFKRSNTSLYDTFWNAGGIFGANPKRIRRADFSSALDKFPLSNTPQVDRLLQQARALAKQIDEVNEISQDIAERVTAVEQATEGNAQKLPSAARGATIASDVLAKHFPRDY